MAGTISGRTAAVSPRAAARRAERAGGRTAVLFVLPAVVLLLAFVVVPFALAFVLSFTNQRIVSPLPTRFVGLRNYSDILSDGQFWHAFENNFLFAIAVVPLQTGLALLLAVLVNRKLRGRVLFRTVFFMPVVMVLAAAAVVWKLLYSPDGLVNGVMKLITLGQFHPDWLASTTWALPAVIVTSIWQGTGFQMIILLAALQDVPEELYEAASIDGAGRWQQFFHVTLPGIRNQLMFVVTITTILSFRLFDQVVIMPTAPGGPLDSTRTIMVELVETGFRRQAIGRGSAIAVVFFLVVLLITILQRRLLREERDVV
jgi:multiple sugar transport system permease protein